MIAPKSNSFRWFAGLIALAACIAVPVARAAGVTSVKAVATAPPELANAPNEATLIKDADPPALKAVTIEIQAGHAAAPPAFANWANDGNAIWQDGLALEPNIRATTNGPNPTSSTFVAIAANCDGRLGEAKALESV